MKCTDWLRCSTYEKSNLNSCMVKIESILNCSSNYDSVMYEVAISSVLNVLDIIPILNQVIQMCSVFIFNFTSLTFNHF